MPKIDEPQFAKSPGFPKFTKKSDFISNENYRPGRSGFEGKKVKMAQKMRYKSESVPDLNVSENEAIGANQEPIEINTSKNGIKITID